MPLDPRIPLQAFNQPPSPQPAQLLSAAFQLRAQQEAAEDRARERQARQRDQSKTQAIADAVRLTADPETGRPNLERAAPEVMQIDPKTAMEFWQTVDAQKLEAERRAVSEIGRSANFILSLPPAQRPQAYAQAVGSLTKAGLIDPSQTPPTYDEAFVRQKSFEAMTYEQQLDALDKMKPPAPVTVNRNERLVDPTTREVLVDAEPENKPDSRNLVLRAADALASGDEQGYRTILRAIRETSAAEDTPSAGERSTWQRVTETMPDGTKVTRIKRVSSGDVIETTPPQGGDDPELPRGVLAYIDDMKGRGYTRAQAEAEFRRTNQQAAHPGLNPIKVKKAFDELFGTEDDFYLPEEAPAPVAPPMGPSTLAAEPTRQSTAATQPAVNAPSTPNVQPNTPAATKNLPKVGDTVTVRGQRYIVGRVYPDGSWDPK